MQWCLKIEQIIVDDGNERISKMMQSRYDMILTIGFQKVHFILSKTLLHMYNIVNMFR